MRGLFRKSRNKLIKSQEGVALLWALVTIAVLLAITGSMAGLIIKESQMASGIDLSVGAYAAAESGIEHGAFKIKGESSSPCLFNILETVSIEANLSYTYSVIGSDGTDTDQLCDNYQIASTGKSGNIVRKIEKTVDKSGTSQPSMLVYGTNNVSISIDSSNPTNFTHDFTGFSPALNLDDAGETKSYIQVFTLKFVDSIPLGGSIGVGLVPNANYNGIFAKFTNNSGAAKVKLSIAGTEKVDTLPSPEAGDKFRVYIEYKKGLAAKASVKKVDIIGGREVETCAQIISQEVVTALPTFTRVYFYNSMVTPTVEDSESTLDIKSGTTVIANLYVMSIKPQ